MPCCCTSEGSRAWPAELVLHLHLRVSGLVPFSKVRVMVTVPDDSLVEAM
jgi:hypothetical protein